MYNVTLWRIRVKLLHPRLSLEPDTVSLEESAFMRI
jgi:hypothetical protein